VATHELPTSPGHVFYEKLLDEVGFDAWVEELCELGAFIETVLRDQTTY